MRCSAQRSDRRGLRGWLRGWVLAGLMLALGVALRAEQAETWTKVTSPYFTILTPAGESTAREWAVELEEFRRGMQAFVPVPVDKLRPVTVVLFATEKAMEPYLPLENGHPARMGGYFVRADEINTIMLSLEGNREEVRHTIYHEAVHWYLSAYDGPMPLWLGEGLAELYATFELNDAKNYTMGNLIGPYVTLLRREPFMPLVRLFGTGRESLLYNEGTRASIFYAQSWALVHYLFYGENSPGRESILRYLQLLATDQSADAAFQQAFGATHGEIEKRLRTYIMRGSYRKHRYKRAADDLSRLVKVAKASPGDVDLALGALLLGSRSPEAAEVNLRRAVALAPADPRGWELLGHLAVRRRDFTEAQELLGRAADARSTNYMVYHHLAVAHFPPSAMPNVGFVALDGAAMDKAAGNYRMAIRLSPSHIASYEGLAGLMHGMQTPDPGDLEVLARGAKLAPGSTTIEAGIAAGEIRAGRVEEGKARLERLLGKFDDDPDAGVRFARGVLASETFRSEMEEINQLARETRYDDALALVERSLAREPELLHRQTLEQARDSLRSYKTIATAVASANRGDVAAARKALEDLLESNPDRAIRSDAERLLREIAKHEAKSKQRVEQ